MNRHGLPVLDAPRPQTKTVSEREVSTTLALNRCANGCRRLAHFQFGAGWFCECCILAEIVRSER